MHFLNLQKNIFFSRRRSCQGIIRHSRSSTATAWPHYQPPSYWRLHGQPLHPRNRYHHRSRHRPPPARVDRRIIRHPRNQWQVSHQRTHRIRQRGATKCHIHQPSDRHQVRPHHLSWCIIGSHQSPHLYHRPIILQRTCHRPSRHQPHHVPRRHRWIVLHTQPSHWHPSHLDARSPTWYLG